MKNLPDGMAFGESGDVVGKVDFDFQAVDENLFEPGQLEALPELSEKEVAMALQLFRLLMSWVWQNGMKNVNGLQIRAGIACWTMLPELRPLNLTEFARGFGMDKQSVGRWHDDFKKRFPQIKTVHMRNTD